MGNNLNAVAVFLLVMGMLPSSPSNMLASLGVPKKGKVVCVGGKWLQVGSLKIWQRKVCVKRRQDEQTDEPPEKTKAPVTIDFDLILPSLEAGPNRGRPEYNPHYGYEPYWPEGGWVFDKDPHSKNATLYMCGIRCPKVYTEYGKICGRNKNYEYKTFLNYCQLRNHDCSKLERWMVMYKGSCFRDLNTYDYHYIQKKTRDIINDFMKRYSKPEHYVGFCNPCPANYT